MQKRLFAQCSVIHTTPGEHSHQCGAPHGHPGHGRGEVLPLHPALRPVAAAALDEPQEVDGRGRVLLPESLGLELAASVPLLDGDGNPSVAACPAPDPGHVSSTPVSIMLTHC